MIMISFFLSRPSFPSCRLFRPRSSLGPDHSAPISRHPIQSAPFDPFGAILQPAPVGGSSAPALPATAAAGNPFALDAPNNNGVKSEKLISADSLEASLMNLGQHLKINPGA